MKLGTSDARADGTPDGTPLLPLLQQYQQRRRQYQPYSLREKCRRWWPRIAVNQARGSARKTPKISQNEWQSTMMYIHHRCNLQAIQQSTGGAIIIMVTALYSSEYGKFFSFEYQSYYFLARTPTHTHSCTPGLTLQKVV